MSTKPEKRHNVDEIIASCAKTPTHYVDYTFNMSVIPQRLLAQVSGAEIDIYAQWVFMVVSQKLRQSVQGQRRINTALNNLPVYRLPDDKMQLGWTVEHALRNQGVNEGGYEHLALEVLLSEVFSEGYAARVVHEMAVLGAGEADALPHFSQILSQIHSSNGLFINTDFARLVEDYVRLDPFNRALKGGTISRIASPKSLADALWHLSKVTDGREQQMSVIGGQLISWFAAASDWLFGLRVSIYTADGVKLHANHGDESSQLLLIYNSYPGIIAQIGSWSDDSEQAKIVARGSPHADTASLVSPQFGGRLVYNTILVRVFGSSFRHLDREESKTFGTVLGSCARILSDIAEKEQSPAGVRRPTATYGQGLLDTLNNWLPELRHLQGRMERQLKLTAEDAGHVYTEQTQKLKSMCGCDICCPTNSDNNKKPGLEGYCLPSLVETIIALGLLLSGIMVATQIFPTRFGLQNFYLKQAEKRLHATLNNVSGHDLFRMLYYDVPDTTRLVQVAEVFSGSAPTTDLHPNLVALAHEGICVFLIRKMEREGSNDGLINVTSGGICVNQKVYRRACLGMVQVEDEIKDVWVEVKCSHLDTSLWCK